MSPWQRATSGPGILVLGGLFFWALAWGLDLVTHIERFGVGVGPHLHGGDALLRINFPLTGAPMVAFGLAQLMGTEALLKRGGLLLWAASILLMLDGLAHAFAFTDHLGQLPSASFFAFVAPGEIGLGLALPFIGRKLDPYIVAGMIGLLALYAISRSVRLAALGWPEAVEALDVFSKAVEILVIVTVLWHGRAAAPVRGASVNPRTAEAAPAAAEP